MSTTKDLIERMHAVGDVHDQRMAELAIEEYDRKENELAQLRAELKRAESKPGITVPEWDRLLKIEVLAKDFVAKWNKADPGDLLDGIQTIDALEHLAALLEQK